MSPNLTHWTFSSHCVRPWLGHILRIFTLHSRQKRPSAVLLAVIETTCSGMLSGHLVRVTELWEQCWFLFCLNICVCPHWHWSLVAFDINWGPFFLAPSILIYVGNLDEDFNTISGGSFSTCIFFLWTYLVPSHDRLSSLFSDIMCLPCRTTEMHDRDSCNLTLLRPDHVLMRTPFPNTLSSLLLDWTLRFSHIKTNLTDRLEGSQDRVHFMPPLS